MIENIFKEQFSVVWISNEYCFDRKSAYVFSLLLQNNFCDFPKHLRFKCVKFIEL